MHAREEMISANLRFVVDVAKKYQKPRPVPLYDLISAGNLGLITAADRFDGTKGPTSSFHTRFGGSASPFSQTLAEHVRTVRPSAQQSQFAQWIFPKPRAN